MRSILITAAVMALAGPVLAQAPASTTLQAVTTRGITMRAFGIEIPIKYTPDGRFSAAAPGTPISGTWRVHGEQLCTRVPDDPTETCAVYPAGKKAGDKFDVPGAMGAAMGVVSVEIN